jgi:hypothetical protein
MSAHRAPHPLVAILVLAACATLVVGADSVTAIWQWAARSSQDKLRGIGARRNPLTGLFIVPSERTLRRVLQDLDTQSLSGSDLNGFLPWNAAPADLRAWAQPPPPG